MSEDKESQPSPPTQAPREQKPKSGESLAAIRQSVKESWGPLPITSEDLGGDAPHIEQVKLPVSRSFTQVSPVSGIILRQDIRSVTG